MFDVNISGFVDLAFRSSFFWKMPIFLYKRLVGNPNSWPERIGLEMINHIK